MNTIDLTRSIIFLWVCFESALNIYVYARGYQNLKNKKRAWESPIVTALIILLASISILSGFMFFCSISRMFGVKQFMDSTFWTPLFILPVGYALDRFRRESMDDGDEIRGLRK